MLSSQRINRVRHAQCSPNLDLVNDAARSRRQGVEIFAEFAALHMSAPVQVLCRFSDAGNDDLTMRCGGRRPKSAKARNRVGK
jgi:hypothetical protein